MGQGLETEIGTGMKIGIETKWWWPGSVSALCLSLSFAFCFLFSISCLTQAFAALSPVQDFQASDVPSDGGDGVVLQWRVSPVRGEGIRYWILVSEQKEGEYRQIAEFAVDSHYETDVDSPWWMGRKRPDMHLYLARSNSNFRLVTGRTYFFKVALTDGQAVVESPVQSVMPRANLFNWAKLNNFFLLLAFASTVLFSIRRARLNPNIFLRRIPGLDAVEEAVGRATEMGRPILYLTGMDRMSSLATIAAVVILGEVAKRVAAYGTDLKVPHRDPIVMAICQEVVKGSYLAAGRPDAYKEASNFFITPDQFAYTAAVAGVIQREKPAAHLFMGAYMAESLLLAEPGMTTGAIQIAGTDSDHQLPFFIAACDYTLIGEELYAASAYLSRDPVLVGTLRGQDFGKGFLLGVLVLGTVLVTLGEIFHISVFHYFVQLFSDFK